MYKHQTLMDVSLTLFDGAASDAAGATAAAGQSKDTGAGTPSAAGKEQPAGAAASPESREEKRKAYRAMVDGAFKEQYIEDTQHIINRRFRETQELRRELARSQPVIDLLMQRYKITDGDVTRLLSAVENDGAYWNKAAEEAGMSVEQFRTVEKLRRENAALLRAEEARRGDEYARRQVRKWNEEASALVQEYPGINLNREIRNPQFLSLLRSGAPVKLAYEAVHMDEIKAGVARQQDRATEKRVVDGIRARGTRPQENGVAARSAFTVSDDVGKLTPGEMAEIRRRVMRGEKISFGS